METRYHVYEIDGPTAIVTVLTTLGMICAAVLFLMDIAKPEPMFTIYIILNVVGTFSLSQCKEIASDVEVHE